MRQSVSDCRNEEGDIIVVIFLGTIWNPFFLNGKKLLINEATFYNVCREYNDSWSSDKSLKSISCLQNLFHSLHLCLSLDLLIDLYYDQIISLFISLSIRMYLLAADMDHLWNPLLRPCHPTFTDQIFSRLSVAIHFAKMVTKIWQIPHEFHWHLPLL